MITGGVEGRRLRPRFEPSSRIPWGNKMTRIRSATLICALLYWLLAVSAPAHAQATGAFDFFRDIEAKEARCKTDSKRGECQPTQAGHLVGWCTDPGEDARVRCIGSISGILIASRSEIRDLKCIPEHVNADQARIIALQQATKTPELLHFAASKFVLYSLSTKFCPNTLRR